MIIKRLIIQNYRNLTYLDINPSSSFNVIYGLNGSGKTSLLEGISYLGYGRSFRAARYQSTIQEGMPYFSISADIQQSPEKLPDSVGIQRYRSRQQKSVISVNADRQCHMIDVIDRICVQVIHPQGIELVIDGPELRRNFLDWGIYYSNLEFKSLWFNYKKLLSQRNAILRDHLDESMLDIYDDSLCSLSEKLSLFREDYLNQLVPLVKEKLQSFLPDFSFDFIYSKGWENGLSLQSVLKQNIEKDRSLGYTFYGCHRADLRIKCNNFNAADILSRGQLKLLVCAMRLAQGQLLKRSTNTSCIFLIDDLSSELDQNSRRLLLEEIRQCGSQVFITNISKSIEIPDCDNAMYIDIASVSNS